MKAFSSLIGILLYVIVSMIIVWKAVGMEDMEKNK